MQSFLINSSDSKFIRTKIDSLKKELSVSIYNYHEINPSPSIGIAEIRKLTAIVSRKSYNGGKRLIYISDFDKATPEAANSILKILEEPPTGTNIIISCSNMNNLLPTVISRCQIIKDNQIHGKSGTEDIDKTIRIIKDIISATPGKRLILSGNLTKTRESAQNLLNSMQTSLEILLKEDNSSLHLSKTEIAVLIRKISAAALYINKNVNTKAVVDILFLGFPKI